MTRIRRMVLAALVGAAGLLPAGSAKAGELWDHLCHKDCPRPSYSPLRYWAPQLVRVHDCVHGPRLSSYPPDMHPEIPPTYIILKYPCPATDPASTVIQPPPR